MTSYSRKICTWALGLNQRGWTCLGWMWSERCCWARSENWKTALLSWSSLWHDYRIPFEMSSPTLKNAGTISASAKAGMWCSSVAVTWHCIHHISIFLLLCKSGDFLETYFYSHSYSSVWYFSIRAHQDIAPLCYKSGVLNYYGIYEKDLVFSCSTKHNTACYVKFHRRAHHNIAWIFLHQYIPQGLAYPSNE